MISCTSTYMVSCTLVNDFVCSLVTGILYSTERNSYYSALNPTFCCYFKQRLLHTIATVTSTTLLLVSSFRAQPNGPLALPVAGRRALGPPGRHPERPGSSWAPPIAPLDLLGTAPRDLSCYGRWPTPPDEVCEICMYRKWKKEMKSHHSLILFRKCTWL